MTFDAFVASMGDLRARNDAAWQMTRCVLFEPRDWSVVSVCVRGCVIVIRMPNADPPAAVVEERGEYRVYSYNIVCSSLRSPSPSLVTQHSTPTLDILLGIMSSCSGDPNNCSFCGVSRVASSLLSHRPWPPIHDRCRLLLLPSLRPFLPSSLPPFLAASSSPTIV